MSRDLPNKIHPTVLALLTSAILHCEHRDSKRLCEARDSEEVRRGVLEVLSPYHCGSVLEDYCLLGFLDANGFDMF